MHWKGARSSCRTGGKGTPPELGRRETEVFHKPVKLGADELSLCSTTLIRHNVTKKAFSNVHRSIHEPYGMLSWLRMLKYGVRADKIRVTIEDPRPTAHIQVEAAVKVTYAPDNVEKSREQNTPVRCTTLLTT